MPLFILGIILYLALPPDYTGFAIIIILPVAIINRLLRNKKTKLDWLMPKAVELPEEQEAMK